MIDNKRRIKPDNYPTLYYEYIKQYNILFHNDKPERSNFKGSPIKRPIESDVYAINGFGKYLCIFHPLLCREIW